MFYHFIIKYILTKKKYIFELNFKIIKKKSILNSELCFKPKIRTWYQQWYAQSFKI